MRCVAVVGLAAALTSGSAWGIALWEQREEGVHGNAEASQAWASHTARRDDSFVGFLVRSYMSAPFSRDVYRKAGTCLLCTQASRGGMRRWAFGWPEPCLIFTEDLPGTKPEDAVVSPRAMISGWKVRFGGLARVLPLRPEWRAAGCDMIAYGGVAAMPLLVRPMLRLVYRRRWGRCLECGYDRVGLGVDAPCPECGAKR